MNVSTFPRTLFAKTLSILLDNGPTLCGKDITLLFNFLQAKHGIEN